MASTKYQVNTTTSPSQCKGYEKDLGSFSAPHINLMYWGSPVTHTIIAVLSSRGVMVNMHNCSLEVEIPSAFRRSYTDRKDKTEGFYFLFSRMTLYVAACLGLPSGLISALGVLCPPPR